MVYPLPNPSSAQARTARFGLAFAIALAVVTVAAPRAFGQLNLELSPVEPALICQQSVEVNLVLSDPTADLRGFSFEITFDPALLRPTEVRAGDVLTQAACGTFFRWVNESDFVDTVAVDAVALGCSASGAGSLLTIVFTSAVPDIEGSSALACASASMRDAQNDDLALVCAAGSLDVTCPVPVDAINWSTLKTLFR